MNSPRPRQRGEPSAHRSRSAVLVVLVLGAAWAIIVHLRAAGVAPTPAPVLGALPIAAHDRDVDLLDGPGWANAFYGVVSRARTSVQLELYELVDPIMSVELVRAHRRGVSVHVLLSRAYHSGPVNTATVRYLRAAGVAVRWASAGTIFHIKAVVADDRTAVVSTGNLVSTDYAGTRDVAVLITDPARVSAIGRTLSDDWGDPSGPAPATAGPGLLWSPGARASFLADIAAARHLVLFGSEELADPGVVGALAADARRGVACYVVMTYAAAWRPAFDTLIRARCHVRVLADDDRTVYLHVKRLVVDPGTTHGSALLGSQNASYTSLTANRELSVRLSVRQDPHVLAAVTAAFWADYRVAASWLD